MELVYTSPQYVSPQGGSHMGILLLQFLNQLHTETNSTIEHTAQAVQHCLESLKQEERRRKELIRQCDEDHAKLSAEYWSLQNEHLLAGSHMDNMEKALKDLSIKYEEEISTLQKQLQKENSARLFCEREVQLQSNYSVLEHAREELYQMKNGSHKDDEKINQILSVLQQLSENQNTGKEVLSLQNQLNVAKETIQNASDMYVSQTKELENEKRKTLALEEQNSLLEASLQKLQKDQQEQKVRFEAEIQKIKRLRAEELEKKDNEISDERKKNAELQRILDENQKKQSDSEKKNAELLEAEKRNCSTQLQQQKIASESKLQAEEKKTQEAEIRLKSCYQELKTAKEQTDVTRKNVTKLREFVNLHKKYVGSGNINYALAVFGDSEIKDIFRLSGINGKQMTKEEACRNGFSCGNGRCIPKCFKCDGTDDCGNRKDEIDCSTTVFPVGARVVRGGDWEWEHQDGNPPGVGTIVDEGNGGWSVVKWDSGHRNNYRIGAEGKFDLRAAAGYFCAAN